ncbi:MULTISPECIES: BlaI/MecI/CopY family transcriptional regulator [unclassified Pseudoalteromonas]|uniref:BlaI/MecI/CopY family transcriptional regulator n=1 Tax=unclassified Pseudoalteromonas TaxID=194690 RepID=UPI0005AA5D61|nr:MULTISPECIES: BlaI/MecI/CopY family transcriptional regulator [unclassified Pseudoalteromonas]MBU2967818.1 BlaI/MecI/CopY family transcriptional regulator [Pseudoalteromonas sp. C2R02]
MTEISKTEFEVLEVLWQQHPASANEIIAKLNENKEWHEKTVKTLLNRMVKKGAIGFEKQQRTYIYTPLLERDSYTLKESKSLLERMFSGKIAPLVAGFAKSDELSKQDISELKQLIDQWEQDND